MFKSLEGTVKRIACHSGTMETFVLSNHLATLANCRLSLKTAWLVMHSLYLRHHSEQPVDGTCHASVVEHDLCRLLQSIYTTSTSMYTYGRYSCSVHLFQCCCQHNCHSVCACFGYTFLKLNLVLDSETAMHLHIESAI